MWQASGKLLLTLCVFAIGAGLGIGLKQGWLPIELLPPPMGTIDSSDTTDEESPAPIARAGADFAQQSEPDPALIEPQGEPEFAAIEATTAPPRRLALPDPAPTASAASQPPASGVQPAQFEQPAPTAKPVASPPDDPGVAATLIKVDAHLAREEWLAAHKELSRLYWAYPEQREEFIDRINQTAQAIFFSPQPHFVEPHVITAGDRLQTVASKYKLTWEYLAQLNQIDPKRIRDGQRLKVIRGPFAAVVELADYSMTVHLQGYFVKRYAVGVGKDGASPIGKHAVLNKVVNPQYTAPDGKVLSGDDPANPLGERWIDLGHSYGIHGTIEPDSIGRAASRGCIRLGNEDVIEVYNFLVNASEVVIRP